MNSLTKETRDALSPDAVLDILRKGNKRFTSNSQVDHKLMQQVRETSGGQHPMAVILSCIDSRTSAELTFDLGIGDVFNCRVAGNVLNEDILGSMEFACKVAGAKLIVVLGHTKCGAIKGACDGVELGNLTVLLQKIAPVIAQETETREDRTSHNAEFVERVASLNVQHVQEQILARSPLLAEMIKDKSIGIVGGMYDVETGMVTFEDSRVGAGQA
jgi:carbonic anhydrase